MSFVVQQQPFINLQCVLVFLFILNVSCVHLMKKLISNKREVEILIRVICDALQGFSCLELFCGNINYLNHLEEKKVL